MVGVPEVGIGFLVESVMVEGMLVEGMLVDE